MNTFVNDLRDSVYESVITVLFKKGIERKICVRVANEVLALFEQDLIIKRDCAKREEEKDILKVAIIEADKQLLGAESNRQVKENQ